VQRLRDAILGSGGKAVHADRAVDAWMLGQPVLEAFAEPRYALPRRARPALEAALVELSGLARVVEEHPAEDGGRKLLLELGDGSRVETVLLPRDGLCVSTQVGCRVGCQFCGTGTLGLVRNLSTEELLAQVRLGRERQKVRRVVFMGMGEPAHNIESVLEAVTTLHRDGRVGREQLVFSTVGHPRVFARLEECAPPPALALSLHSLDRDRRRALLPRAPDVEPRELLAEAVAYAARNRHPLQLQWTLIAGRTDGLEEAEELAGLVRGTRTVVNYIPVNAVDGLEFQRPSRDHIHALVARVQDRGVLAKVRWSAAQDATGGCGQLVARSSTKG
jgi:23S rRNA (adenine2503-C2)-methyltransferase